MLIGSIVVRGLGGSSEASNTARQREQHALIVTAKREERAQWLCKEQEEAFGNSELKYPESRENFAKVFVGAGLSEAGSVFGEQTAERCEV